MTNVENEVTTVKYNQRFQTFEVKDAINQTYTFSYDPLGRLLSQTRAGGTMSFEYDNVGNRKKRTDYMGRVTNYTFDNVNRLTKIEYDLGTGNDTDKPQSTYAYDEISRLTSAVNNAGTVSFNYDNRGRVISTTDVFGKVIAYEYERTSTVNQKRLKLDGTSYAAYNYDDAGRLANIVNSSDSTTTTFGYDNADKLTSRVFPNGVTTNYEYYNNGLLKRLKDSTTSATLFDRQYTYNTANQISQLAELTQTRNFTYDNVDRLTGATNGTTTESYTFDDVGNRTASHLSASYGYQSGKFNQLASTATASFQFDANGNTIQKSEGKDLWRYTWDYENRLTEAATRKEKVRYKYDALGRRVERNLNSGKERTKYTLDGLDVLVDNDDGTLTKYLNGPGIDNKLRAQTGATVNYFLADHLGSTNGLADATGNITSSASYDSFGNKTGNLVTRYQFTGREYDNFSGQYFYRARFYDAGLGRFTSEDPIGFGGGINQFAYVRNSPTGKVDPSGLYERDVHYSLTRYLAMQNGCFSSEGAERIAAGDQGTDDNPVTAPGFGRDFANSYYHALNPDAQPGVGPGPMLPNLPYSGPEYFGRYLHYLQDTFSHSGYTNSTYGHMFRAHGNDKTATDVEKTMRMAQSTFSAMSGYSQLVCGCKGKQWDSGMESAVRAFASVPTSWPNLADIDGNIGEGVSNPFFASPSAMAQKNGFLGF